jgi:hypothetical protein
MAALAAMAMSIPTQQEIADIRRHLKRPSVTDPAKKAARKRQRKARAIQRRHA